MSEQNPAQQNQVPYGQGQQWQAPGASQPVTRTPLTAEQKRGAMIAGGVGFALMTLGFGIVSVVVVVLFVFGLLGFIGTALARSGETSANMMADIVEFAQMYWWIALLVAVVGVILWLAGYFASVRILKSSGNRRATAITWAGLGIAIVANWLVGSVLSIPASLINMGSSDSGVLTGALLGGGLVFGLLGLAATVAIGVFAWWWMAHALRVAPAAESAANPPV